MGRVKHPHIRRESSGDERDDGFGDGGERRDDPVCGSRILSRLQTGHEASFSPRDRHAWHKQSDVGERSESTPDERHGRPYAGSRRGGAPASAWCSGLGRCVDRRSRRGGGVDHSDRRRPRCGGLGRGDRRLRRSGPNRITGLYEQAIRSIAGREPSAGSKGWKSLAIPVGGAAVAWAIATIAEAGATPQPSIAASCDEDTRVARVRRSRGVQAI